MTRLAAEPLCALAVTLAGTLGALGCGDRGGEACGEHLTPSGLVTGAALFRVDLYAALGCDALASGATPVATLSRTYPAGAAIILDAPPGAYAIVLTSYLDAAGREPLGNACSTAQFGAGTKLCLSLALDAVDLAGGIDPTDLGPLDLAAVDLGYASGTVLARDDFQRPDQQSWGAASDGQRWGASAGGTNSFSIVTRAGQVAAGGSATYPASLGPPVSDAEVLATATIGASGAHWGGQLRNGGGSTTYAAMLDGATLSIRRVDSGATTVLAQTSFAVPTGTAYTIRFRAAGNLLKARVWPAASTEPTTWTLTASDTVPLGPGFGGLRFNVPGTSSVLVTSFLLTSL